MAGFDRETSVTTGISVITPSFNMQPYLELCAASIADQEGGGFEHIVVDGASTDGTVQWLARQQGIEHISEKDSGMYDAINKGLRRAKGEILAYLNCDEQYLPGTLEFVREYFRQHPGVDMIFGDMVLTRPDGSLIAFRKAYRPRWFYILAAHLYLPSCTMFFRRKLIEGGLFFDLSFRANADADFVVRALRGGARVKYVRRYLSAFTMTGKNLSGDAVAGEESKRMLDAAPFLVRKTRWLLNALRLTEKYFSGAYFQKKPLEYDVYTRDSHTQRTHFSEPHPSYKWQWE